MKFAHLADAISKAHQHLAVQTSRAVNLGLTLRNWIIGAYILEYEQNGEDRSVYGERLLENLAKALSQAGVPASAPRSLRLYRQFYAIYPEIWQTVSAKSALTFSDLGIWQTLSAKNFPELSATSPATSNSSVPATVSPDLLQKLSFSHFVELLQLDDPLKRRFYEVESLRGNWSVRELKRQIDTLYFERSGLSRDKQALAQLADNAVVTPQRTPRQVIRDPYIFEFLGLKAKEVMGESDLEDALLDKLQGFLLELGHGFCFEACQKRLLIGDEYYFVDLVFYHRILKCHVLIELKNDAFRHEHLGQLNSYVACYRQTQMTDGDNPPVGILLCTRKNHALVEFALAGMDNALFVSRYAVELPRKDEVAAFLDQAIAELGGGDE